MYEIMPKTTLRGMVENACSGGLSGVVQGAEQIRTGVQRVTADLQETCR